MGVKSKAMDGKRASKKGKRDVLKKRPASIELDYVLSYLSHEGYQDSIDLILKQGIDWKAREVKRKSKRLVKWARKAERVDAPEEKEVETTVEMEEDDVEEKPVTPSTTTLEVADQDAKTSQSSTPLPVLTAKASVSTQSPDGPTLELKTTSKSKPIRFQRIKIDEQVYHDDRLKNMSYNAKGTGVQDGDWGARANADLSVTRGKGFRKEKDKKKRGSYRGGTITDEVHSVRFPGSDSE